MLSFFRNICRFNQCGLEFASLYDLIQHIEEDHVTDDNEFQKRFNSMQQHGQQPASLVPLSYICRYYKVLPDKKPKPITAEPVKMAVSAMQSAAGGSTLANAAATPSHSHHLPPNVGAPPKKHPAGRLTSTTFHQPFPPPFLQQSQGQQQNQPPPPNVTAPMMIGGNEICDEETVSIGNESMSPDSASVMEDGMTSTLGSKKTSNASAYDSASFNRFTVPDDRRFMGNARKRYRNMNGGRFHSKISHPNAALYNKIFKCTSCEKSYKTHSGLHNHQMQCSHGSSTNSSGGSHGSSSIGSSGGGSQPVPNVVSGLLAQVAAAKQRQQNSLAGVPRLQPQQQQPQQHTFSSQQQARLMKNVLLQQQQQQMQQSHMNTIGGSSSSSSNPNVPLALITASGSSVNPMKSGAIRVSPAPSPSLMKYGGANSSGSLSPINANLPSGVSIQVQQQPSPRQNRGMITKTPITPQHHQISGARPAVNSGILAAGSGMKRSSSNAQMGRTYQRQQHGALENHPRSLASGQGHLTKIQITSAVVPGCQAQIHMSSSHPTMSTYSNSTLVTSSASNVVGDSHHSGAVPGPPVLTTHEYARRE